MGESRSDYSLSIIRIAVAQICQSVGYEAAGTSALDTLSDIATRYLKAVAKSATDSANSCGRTHSNLIDILVAFEDLGSVQGFAGASSSSWSRIQASIINSSSLLKEIRKFVLYSDEIPFAQPLPQKNFTGRRGAHRNKVKGSYNCEMNLGHVPRWLPEMPAIEGRNDVEIEESLGWDFGVQNMVVEGEGRRKEWGRGDGRGLDLPRKRRKVRFEMGLKGNTGGVVSRVGIGKRVLCHNLGSGTGASDTIEAGNERKKTTETMKMVTRPA